MPAAGAFRAFQVPPTLRALNEGNMGTIGDMLNNIPEPEAVAEEVIEQLEVQEEAKPETAERPRGPDGKFISKETGVEPTAEAAEPVPPTEQANQLPPAEYAALKDERRKRQALEDEIARLRAPPPPVQQPPQQPVEFWDDPQGFMAGFGEQLLQKWEQKQQVQRINASEEAAKARHPDYEQAFGAFSQAVQLNPTMAYEMAQAPDPAEYAYRKGKTALEIQKVGSVDELRAQIRAELEAEARAVIQPPAKLPSTTAADGSVGVRTGPEWAGPTPLGSMIG